MSWKIKGAIAGIIFTAVIFTGWYANHPGPGIAGCTKGRDTQGCMADRTLQVAQEKDLTTALFAAEKAAQKDPKLMRVCHDAMHDLVTRYDHVRKEDFINALEVPGNCSSGYLHGVIATMTQETKSIEKTGLLCDAMKIQSNARSAKDDYLASRDCYHGIGHGLKPGSSAHSAIQGCNKLKKDELVIHCAGGVWMEAALSSKKAASTCLKEKEMSQASCFAFSVTKFNQSPQNVDNFCSKAQYKLAHDLCFINFGRLLYQEKSSWCQKFNLDEAKLCLRGFIRGWGYEARQLEMSDLLGICEGQDTLDLKKYCAQQTGSLVNLQNRLVDKNQNLVTCPHFKTADLQKICIAQSLKPAPTSLDLRTP